MSHQPLPGRFSSRLRARLAVACLLLATPACGDSADAVPPDAPTVRDAAAPDAPAPAQGSFVSNTPGARVLDHGAPAPAVLALRSSNLLQHPSGNQVFQEWFGEVQNVGSTTICFAELTTSFLAADGTQLVAFDTFADGDPYTDGSSLTIPCLAPGQIGGLWDNDFAASSVPLEDIKTISIKFDHAEFGAPTPAPNAPLVASQVTSVSGGLAVMGTITGRTSPIYNIALNIFPRDAGGLVFDILFAADLGTLNPGDVFAFTAARGNPTAFSQYRTYTDFIDGAHPAAAMARSARSAEPTAIDARITARGQRRDQARARAAIAAAARR